MDVNIFVQVGFVVLVGLACKNAILIVEFARDRQQEGASRFDAAVEAAKVRLRPIIMTSFAFVLGVLPLAVAQGAGAEMRRTLGTAVFAGMIGVTLFGIFLTPVFYSIGAPVQRPRAGQARGRARGRHGASRDNPEWRGRCDARRFPYEHTRRRAGRDKPEWRGRCDAKRFRHLKPRRLTNIAKARETAMTTTTYRAVQVSKPGRLELVERELTAPPPGKVRIRIEACGVCHSDVLTVDGLSPGISYPRVPGHEVVGKIDALGEGVSAWKLGQRVGVGFLGGPCGHCTPCRRGDFVNCENQAVSGVAGDGGYAEVMIADERSLAAVPAELAAAEARPCCAPA